MGRILLLVTTPRLPAGLLTAAAWDVLRAHPVLSGVDSPQCQAVRAAGVDVTVISGSDPVGQVLAAVATHDTVVWLAGPAGDEDFARGLGLRLTRQPSLATMELLYGSWDPPGARLLDVVTVMDRLASPGGDPWKREQTHQTLARYLLEEAYEAYDAIDAHDLAALREELGDVLLQVVLHARMAQEADPGWSIDDLAGELVDKLIRRNPHVFAGVAVSDLDEIVDNWERIKQQEKARQSALDGIALAQPALALAAKILSRARRAELPVPVPEPAVDLSAADEQTLGEALFAMVARAQEQGLDAEAALRRVALARARAIRDAEDAAAR